MKNIFYKITARTMGLNRTRTIVTILGVILSAAMLTAVAVFGISVLNYIETKTVEKEGSWSQDNSGFYTVENGASLAFSFNGTGFWISSVLGSNMGGLQIQIDENVSVISCNSDAQNTENYNYFEII